MSQATIESYSARVLREALIRPAKTGADVSVMEHASHVLQVALYLARNLDLPREEKNRLCLLAALHDLGKTITAPQGGRWPHSRASESLIDCALADPSFRSALAEAGIETDLDANDLSRLRDLVRDHHALGPTDLLHTPSAALFLIADAIASTLEEGWSGPIETLLGGSDYHTSALALMRMNGWDDFSRVRIHRVSFPADTISELILAESVIEEILGSLDDLSLELVMRESASLWLSGSEESIERFLERTIGLGHVVDHAAFAEVYARPGAPRVPVFSVESLSWLLLSDEVALDVLQALFRDCGMEKKEVLEKYALTWDALTAGHSAESLLAPEALAEILYAGIRARLMRFTKHAPPLADSVAEALAEGRQETMRREAALMKAIRKHAPKSFANAEILKKMITASNSGRSILNVFLARAATREEIADPRNRLRIADVADLDGVPVAEDPPELSGSKNKYRSPCACCGQRLATIRATSLVMGPTEGDGLWASAGARRKSRICLWCYMAGIADLPLVSVRKMGTRNIRETNYLMVRSVLCRQDLIRTLATLGLINETEARLAEQEPSQTEPILDEDDTALFESLFDQVPERESALRVGGMLNVVRSRGVRAFMLPGKTPLATRCVFALPSAAFFGFHQTARMNQEIMDLVSAGVMASLSDVLGPSSLNLRATGQRARVSIGSRNLSYRDLDRAKALWELAETRRAFAFRHTGIQDPDNLDIAFVHQMRIAPRRAAAAFVREIRGSKSANANRLAEKVRLLIERIAPGENDPDGEALREIVARLRSAGLIERKAGVLRYTARTGLTPRSEGRMTGVLLRLWRARDTRDVEAWIGSLPAMNRHDREEIERVRQIFARRAEQGDFSAFLRRLNSEGPLLSLEAD